MRQPDPLAAFFPSPFPLSRRPPSLWILPSIQNVPSSSSVCLPPYPLTLIFSMPNALVTAT